MERAKYDKTQDRCNSPVNTALLVLFGFKWTTCELLSPSLHVCMVACARQFAKLFFFFKKQQGIISQEDWAGGL